VQRVRCHLLSRDRFRTLSKSAVAAVQALAQVTEQMQQSGMCACVRCVVGVDVVMPPPPFVETEVSARLAAHNDALQMLMRLRDEQFAVAQVGAKVID
jgi:hypothetical protein